MSERSAGEVVAVVRACGVSACMHVISDGHGGVRPTIRCGREKEKSEGKKKTKNSNE